MLQRTLSSLLLCLAPFVLLVTFADAAMEHEPNGFGKAHFGMSPQEVEKLYAGTIRTLGQENLGASPVYGPRISRQLLPDQKVPGFNQPTNVELRYWDNKLWVVIIYYGQNGLEEVNAALRKEYGKPPTAASDSMWSGSKVMVNTANRERWYAISDIALSKEAQAVFMEDLRKAQERMRAQPAAPPAAPAEK
jgi:hypothetical protein